MIEAIGLSPDFSFTQLLATGLWPKGLSCWAWGGIFIVLYFVNVFISARVLLPTGLPSTGKRQRISNAFLLTLILAWPLVYLILVMLTERGEDATTLGLIGAIIGWVFFVVVDFIGNWKLFEKYYPLRQELGGSDAYANLHRHIWGHILTIVALVISLLGVLIWSVMN